MFGGEWELITNPTYSSSSSSSNSCGWNPFCHAGQAIQLVVILICLSICLGSCFYFQGASAMMSSKKNKAKWVSEINTTVTDQKESCCTEETWSCPKHTPNKGFGTRNQKTCCTPEIRGQKMCNDEFVTDVRCIPDKLITPCLSCRHERTYELNGETAVQAVDTSQQTSCESNNSEPVNLNRTIYANPDNIHDVSYASTSETKKDGIMMMGIGCASFITGFVVMYCIYKTTKEVFD